MNRSPVPPTDTSRHIRRMIFTGIMLFSEYFLLSLLFDFDSFLKKNSFFKVFGYLGTIAPLAMIIATAFLIIIGKQLRTTVITNLQSIPYKKNLSLCAIHLASYTILLLITNKIFNSGGWSILWIVCLMLVGCSAAVYALPLPFLARFIRQNWKVLMPVVIMGILAWVIGLNTSILWPILRNATFTLVHSLLYLLPGTPIVNAEHYTLGTAKFSVNIANSCSGFQGIGLMAVFMGGYLFFNRKELQFPLALLLVPIALIAVWLANALRIFLLITIGDAGYAGIAFGGFHAKAGWVLFCALALGITAICQHLGLFRKERITTDREMKTDGKAAVYLLPFLIAVAAAMITGMFSADEIDRLYPLRIIAAGAMLWLYRKELPIKNPFSWSTTPIIFGIGIAVLWIILDYIFYTQEPIPFPRSLSNIAPWYPALWIFFKIAGSCLIIPIIEELAFRGFLLRRMMKADFTTVSYRQFTWLSFIGSSIAFGLMHGEMFIAGILAGMAYAWVVRKRGRLIDAVIAHTVSNLVIAVYVLIFRKWALWW